MKNASVLNSVRQTQPVNDKPRIYGEPYTSADSDMFGISFEGEVSLTKQSEAESCDINQIMKRYEATGLLPDMIDRNPVWGDFSDMATFHEAQEIVAKATEQFNSLDAHIRKEFGNDPARFLEFCEDPKNIPRLVDMGLATVTEPLPTPEITKPEGKSTASKPKGEPE